MTLYKKVFHLRFFSSETPFAISALVVLIKIDCVALINLSIMDFC